jgi:predicted PurR-regulated permease PerM
MAQDPPSLAPAAPNAGEQGDIVRLAAWLIVAAGIIGGLYIGQGVLIPLAVAFLISFALSPPVTWLNRLGLPRVLSVVVVMLIAGVLLAGVGFLVGSQIKSLSAQLPTYQATVHAKLDDIRSRIRATGILDAVKEETAVAGPAAVIGPTQRIEVVQPSASPFETAIAWLAPALEPIATAGIVLVFVFLALIDRSDLRDRLIRLMGGNLHRSTSALEEAGKRISKYLLMQVVVNVSYAIPMALGLWFIGVPGWILWGALAALMRFVPYAGPLISAIFPIALAFAVDPGWNMVIWTVALILLLELISNNIVEPLLYGTSTGLSAMSLIAAATFWTALWGPVGLILSTPLTVCLLVVGRNLPQLQFLDTLLGSVPVLDIPTRIYQRLIADDPDEAIEIVDEAIGDGSVGDFYDEYGIEVLRRINDDRQGNARAEHRLRVASGMDVLLDDLREEYPPPLAPDTPPRVACIGGKREIDSVACEMLAHALSLDGLPAVERREGAATARYVDKLDLDGVEVICLSYFSRQPELSARTFCRRLRRRWPGRKIVVALWNAPDELLEPERIEAMGADEAVASVDEAIRRIRLLLAPEEKLLVQVADTPDNDAARVAALEATEVLDGHAREDLDALAKRAAEVFDVRFAVISAVSADAEFIIGQSTELPGTRTGTDMITMPRDAAICDHVVASGETLVVDDTERDPRFSDHPAIKLWRTRFYAGAPLMTADGLVLGALCLLDSEPRHLDDEEVDLLGTLAADVVSVITGDAVVEPEQRARDETSATVGQVVPE